MSQKPTTRAGRALLADYAPLDAMEADTDAEDRYSLAERIAAIENDARAKTLAEVMAMTDDEFALAARAEADATIAALREAMDRAAAMLARARTSTIGDPTS